jgi:hypothetical protein
MKSIVTHAGLLALASVMAFGTWSRVEKTDKDKPDMVEVWTGSAEAVEAVSYENKQKKVQIAPRRDELGRYYAINVDKEEPAAPHPHPGAPDAGAPPVSTPPKHELLSFVGVKEAGELIEKLATLKAVRSLGKFDPKRAADYGLDKPEGTLKVKVSGKEQVVTIGGQTPGGSERYAKYSGSNEIFALEGDLVQSLAFADSRLMTRELHAFLDDEVKKVRVSKGAKARELVRVTDKGSAWADVGTPTKADETAVNWMTKLDRLRSYQFVEKPAAAPTPDQLVVRVDYYKSAKPMGFFELYKVPGEKAPEYLVKTEFTRWFVKVVSGSAEQLDQDLGALLK